MTDRFNIRTKQVRRYSGVFEAILSETHSSAHLSDKIRIPTIDVLSRCAIVQMPHAFVLNSQVFPRFIRSFLIIARSVLVMMRSFDVIHVIFSPYCVSDILI